MKKRTPSRDVSLESEITELRRRLQEAEETIEAIRDGHVEALVIASPTGPRVFTLEGADHRYRRLVETMNEGALLISPEGLVLYSNASFAEMVATPLPHVVGRPFADFVDPAAHRAFEALWRAGGAGKAADEIALRTPDGQAVVTYVSLSPNDPGDDSEFGTCAIVTNLTAQKRSEEIVASERLASSILDQVAEVIVVCDRAGRVIRASRAARAVASGPVELAPVRVAFPLEPLDDDRGRDGAHEHPAALALEGRVATGVEMCLNVRGREPLTVICTAAPLENDRGEVLGCVLSLTDITDRKRAEAERADLLAAERAARTFAEKARADAEASNRAKDEFLATVSHELRTPLNAIVGWSRLIVEGALPEAKKAHAIEVIRRNADAQARLIEDLLDVSRIVSGKMRLDVQPLEPARVVRAVVETVRPAIEAKEIKLATHLSADASLVLGDEARLQQVIWNLVSNAAKFTPRRGNISIKLERVDELVVFVISDDGRGIGPEFLPYVFDRFRQADGGIDRQHGGLGLGLAISRHLVELHGGHIEVASEGDGRGATFTVRLPRAGAVAPASEAGRSLGRARRPTPAGVQYASLAGVRVLLVEDDQDSREVLTAALARCGARVESTSSGADALARIAASAPDVLVSDIGMPDMDGYALIRRVRALEAPVARAVPALALTAYARPEDRVRALAEGFQMHLAKPVDPAEFAVVVATLAGRARDAGAPAGPGSDPGRHHDPSAGGASA